MTTKKKPETQLRYRVHCETQDLLGLGPLVATLTEMGYQKVGFELVTETLTYKRSNNGMSQRTRRDEITAAFIDENPSFRTHEFKNVIRDAGFSDATAYKLLNDFVTNKTLRRDGDQYHVAVNKVPVPTNDRKTYDVSCHELVVGFAKKHQGKFTREQVQQVLRTHKRPISQASAVCSTMMKKKLAKRVGPAQYVLLAAAKKKPTAKKKTKPNVRMLNGSSGGEHVTETATNG